jgi:hypothetical protein
VADVYRRITVRVAGSEVTQFATTVKIPDEVYREPKTLLNVLVFFGLLLGWLALIALVIAGFVVALRKGHFPWRRAARWTLALAIVPLGAALATRETLLFNYTTTESWQTFITGQITGVALRLGLALGVIFLSVVAIDTVYPEAFELWRRRARGRFGRAALLGALATIALVALHDEVFRWLTVHFPAASGVGALSVPASVAIPLPALVSIGWAVVGTIVGSAAVGLLVQSLRGMTWRPWLPWVVVLIALFLRGLDPSATAKETPLMLLNAATLALIAGLAARYLLGRNLLAYPLTIALAMLLSNVSTLLQNQRPDLLANAVAEIVVIAALVLWVAAPSESAEA